MMDIDYTSNLDSYFGDNMNNGNDNIPQSTPSLPDITPDEPIMTNGMDIDDLITK